MSFQYSIPYLQSQVKDLGLPSFLGDLIPVVEVTWSAPVRLPEFTRHHMDGRTRHHLSGAMG